MTKRITIVSSILIGTILISASCGINPAYTTFCHTIAETSGNNADWHLAIYLDVKACLSCCEDMEAWQELEEKLPECGGSLSLWAPHPPWWGDLQIAPRDNGFPVGSEDPPGTGRWSRRTRTYADHGMLP